jgi:L-seryl-tRNA(Ser) seleniumtransferase
MRKNPLYRALRVDKMTVAALDAVLAVHEAGQAALHVPVQRMLAATPGDIRRRAEALAADLRRTHPELELVVVDGASAVGGGAAPEVEVPTALLAVIHPSLGPERLAGALRAGRPAVLARVADGRLLLDLRTVLPGEEAALLEALDRACRAER